jgi:N-formylglutamate deformylase
MSQQIPFFITMPHSGEKIPDLCRWLSHLPEEVLMCDVDRYIDILYEPAISAFNLSSEKTEWHRYVVDLNRVPSDVDCSSVENSSNPTGSFNRGFHWVVTTQNDQLLKKPLSIAEHEALTELIYTPFHMKVRSQFSSLKQRGFKNAFHLDAHSMPSLGTKMHKDPGEKRADVVISDSLGKSCDPRFRDLVIAAYVTAGFKVGYNWPYVGGRLTEQYGQPHQGQHTIQVELNRSLYMNEMTKKINPDHVEIQNKIKLALRKILTDLESLSKNLG